MNFTLREGSNRLAASMSPRLPSWMRSRNDTPRPRYRLAYDTTKRRLASTRRVTAASSPSQRIRAPSARSSSALKRESFEISRRYAASALASSPAAYRFDTRLAYISTETENSILSFHFCIFGLMRRANQISRRGFDQRRRQPLLPVV